MNIKKQKFIDALKRLEDFEKKHNPNMALLNEFPNALLVESSMINKSRKRKPIEKKNEPQENDNDVWNILNKMKKEHESETLESLTECDNVEDVDVFSKCPSCNKAGMLVEDCRDGVVVCSSCGIVNQKLIDYGAEWRSYNNDDNRGEGMNRCGCPTNFFFPKSSQGTIVVGTRNSRLRRKQTWIGTVYKERSLSQVFNYITKICVKNNISKIIIDTAKTLYQKISNCKYKGGKNDGKQIIIRGDNRKSVIANCVHKACEINHDPRTIKEIAQYFDLEEKKITKGNKQFKKILKNADDTETILNSTMNNTAEDFIKRYCTKSKLKLSKEEFQTSIRIANNCCRMKLATGHNPRSIGAGSVLCMVNYYGINVDKKLIARIFKTSDVTVNKIFNKLEPYIDALADDEATDYLIKKFNINS